MSVPRGKRTSVPRGKIPTPMCEPSRNRSSAIWNLRPDLAEVFRITRLDPVFERE
jgi:hypothetical protein